MRESLRSAWFRPAAAGAAGPRVRDGVLVGVLAVLMIGEVVLRTDLRWPLPAVLVALAALAGVPWRRTHPLTVIVLTTAVTAAFEVVQRVAGLTPAVPVATIALLILPYAVFRWGSGRARIVGGAVLAAGFVLSVALGDDGVGGGIAGIAVLGGTCLVGVIRRERVAARERERDAIRLQEREALARDLHDTVAHHVSSIAIRAQAGQAAPATAGESLEAIEHDAQETLAQLRSLVRVLRDPAGYEPPPGIDQLRALADPGPPEVVVRVEGADGLPAVVATTLFRIAQEGVTNARRHARSADRIGVELIVEAGTALLSVHDDGAAARPPKGEGHGLRGVSERAALLGGTASAGPDPAGGWTLRATLPVKGER